MREDINEQQQRDFLVATNLMVAWQHVKFYVSETQQIPAEDIPYERAMEMMKNEGFTACPF